MEMKEQRKRYSSIFYIVLELYNFIGGIEK